MAKSNADPKPGKTYSADVVAALLMSNDITSLSMKQYELMSAFDGEKTASGFQHDFRSVLAKARDIKQRIADGEKFEPVTPTKKRAVSTSADNNITPTKKAKTAPKPTNTPKTPRAKTPRAKKDTAKVASGSSSLLDQKSNILDQSVNGSLLDDDIDPLDDAFNEFIKQELTYD